MADLTVLAQEALAAVAACADLAALDEARVHWLGKKGLLTEQLKALGGLPAAERPGHVSGWTHYLARLRVAGAGRDPGPDPGMPAA